MFIKIFKKIIGIYILIGPIMVHARTVKTDLLIVGGGTSGIAAGLQSSRMGIHTLLIEETEWLGGMITSAGVSAIDGNHQLPSGIWGEFRQKIYTYYGGPDAVKTGSVSNTLFEPSVGNRIFKEMAVKEHLLNIWYRTNWLSIKKEGDLWIVKVKRNNQIIQIETGLVIDATELGDIMAASGVKYSIGMDSRLSTGESFAPEKANNIVQDLTYVMTLKDYGTGTDKTIIKPAGYDAKEFTGSCFLKDTLHASGAQWSCELMMQYGKLPNHKYMINWPISGNDFYLNIIEKTPAERKIALQAAKQHALRFLYYLQHELGYKSLSLADDEYPTSDGLPMIPYYRESRRMKGLVTLTVNYLTDPYGQQNAYYRTGIAVGDYVIDHHHGKNPETPKIDFVKIKIPAYNIPLGSLIPEQIDGLIVAEKSISVSNIVNGTTRLQPVVLEIGQAAGALAAVSIRNKVQPRAVSIRDVQQELLNARACLLPLIDVKPEELDFASIQRISATGILKATGVPYKWANETWFYPDYPISEYELISGLKTYYPQVTMIQGSGKYLTIEFLIGALRHVKTDVSYTTLVKDWKTLGLGQVPDLRLQLDRRKTAVLLDHYLNPFAMTINFNGALTNTTNL